MSDQCWVELEEFPGYSVSNHGCIRNDETGRLVSTSKTRQGGVKVGLCKNGRQYTRSVRVLVAEAFLPAPVNSLHDTPININGNQQDNRAENLAWRPRWFAWKFHHQLEIVNFYIDMGPIFNRHLEVEYESVAKAGLTQGLLFHEVHLSLENNIPVFPVWHVFDWVYNRD